MIPWIRLFKICLIKRSLIVPDYFINEPSAKCYVAVSLKKQIKRCKSEEWSVNVRLVGTLHLKKIEIPTTRSTKFGGKHQ